MAGLDVGLHAWRTPRRPPSKSICTRAPPSSLDRILDSILIYFNMSICRSQRQLICHMYHNRFHDLKQPLDRGYETSNTVLGFLLSVLVRGISVEVLKRVEPPPRVNAREWLRTTAKLYFGFSAVRCTNPMRCSGSV